MSFKRGRRHSTSDVFVEFKRSSLRVKRKNSTPLLRPYPHEDVFEFNEVCFHFRTDYIFSL